MNYWSEFLFAHIGALHDYSIDSDALSLAKYVLPLTWRFPLPNASTTVKSGSGGEKSAQPWPPFAFDTSRYTLAAYWNDSTHLVHGTPKPLVDYPRSSALDLDSAHSRHCDDLCVQMNAYAALAHRWAAPLLATLALGKGGVAAAAEDSEPTMV